MIVSYHLFFRRLIGINYNLNSLTVRLKRPFYRFQHWSPPHNKLSEIMICGMLMKTESCPYCSEFLCYGVTLRSIHCVGYICYRPVQIDDLRIPPTFLSLDNYYIWNLSFFEWQHDSSELFYFSTKCATILLNTRVDNASRMKSFFTATISLYALMKYEFRRILKWLLKDNISSWIFFICAIQIENTYRQFGLRGEFLKNEYVKERNVFLRV